MWKWAAALVFVGLACFGQAQRPLVREEIQVGQETWRPEWKSAPVEACGPREPDSFTCPCAGFAFGQAGDLDLVQVRVGKVFQRLSLGKFFQSDGAPEIYGHPVVRLHEQLEQDFAAGDEATARLQQAVERRPVTQVIKLADYNHDGRATEFYLQTDSFPCGSVTGIVIGTTVANPKLHAFGTAKHPKAPLFLRDYEWEALLNSNGVVQTTHLACGDHGIEQEIEYTISTTAKGIAGVARSYDCTEDNKKSKLLDTVKWSFSTRGFRRVDFKLTNDGGRECALLLG